MTETTDRTIDAHQTSEKVHDPIHRASYAFRNEGERLWVYTWLQDGGNLPEHFHPSLEEHWEALEGTVRVKLDGLARPRPRGRAGRWSPPTSGTSSRTRAAARPTCAPR